MKFFRSAAHVVSLIAPMALSIAVLSAQSQPPIPGAGKGQRPQPSQQSQTTQQQPTADPRGTEQSPVVVKVQPTPKTDEEAAKEKAKEQTESSAKQWTLGLAIGTGMVGLLQSLMIFVQARIAANQNRIMEAQSRIMTGQRDAAADQGQTLKLQAETLGKQHSAILAQSVHMAEGLRQAGEQIQIAKDAAIAAEKSARVAADTLTTNQVIERAYVTMSHTPPGVKISHVIASVTLSVCQKPNAWPSSCRTVCGMSANAPQVQLAFR